MSRAARAVWAAYAPGLVVRGLCATGPGRPRLRLGRPLRAPPTDLVIVHTNLYWKYQVAPGRRGGTVETAEVSFAGP